MGRALNSSESESPLDVNIESVLPGVHVRFTNIEDRIEDNNVSLHLIYNQQQAAIATNDERHSLFVEAARWFSNRLGDGVDGSPPVVQAAAVFGEERMEGEGLEAPPEYQEATSDNEVPPSARIWRPCRSHVSMTSLWNEYYGMGAFQDKPVVGGIDALEQTYGNGKWRKHIVKSESKFFTRFKNVALAARSYIEVGEKPIDEGLGELDVIFEQEAKSAVPNMLLWFQANNYFVKRAKRGKRW
jgi:hypothetical protein